MLRAIGKVAPIHNENRTPRPSVAALSYEEYRAALEELIGMAKSRDMKVVLVDEKDCLPTRDADVRDRLEQILRETAQKHETAFFPARRELQNQYDHRELCFPWDLVHLNTQGHREVGQRLARFLIENELL